MLNVGILLWIVDGKYFLGWEVNSATGTITFNITVESTAYIGLGVSPGKDYTIHWLFKILQASMFD